MANKDFKGFKKDEDTYNCYDPTARSGVNNLIPRVGIAEGKIATLEEQMLSVQDDLDNLGTASTKNSTSVVTDSSDLVESGAVYDALQEFTKKVSNNDVYGLRQSKGNMVDFDIVGGSLAWNQLVRNGNFANTNNWSASASSTFTVSNHVATYKAAVKCDNLSTVIAQAERAGHKLLYSYKSKSYINSGTTFMLRKFTSISPVAYTDTVITLNTSNTDYSGIVSIAPDIVRLMVLFQDNNASEWGNIEISNVMIIDLTQLFGSTIADYIYSLEQATEGAGVEWFRQYFPNDYYAYSAGAIQSVNVESRKVVGFNQWDEAWESGGLNPNTGENQTDVNAIRSKNLIPIMPNTVYYSKIPASYGTGCCVAYYDAKGVFLGAYPVGWDGLPNNDTFTTKPNAFFMRFTCNSATFYNNDICINISNDKNGQYEPYAESVYPFDSTKQLRGIPKLVDNKLNYDGDIYTADGQITRKYGIVDLGTLTFEYDNSLQTPTFRTPLSTINGKSNSINIVCPKYTVKRSYWDVSGNDMCTATGGYYLNISNSAYTDAATFKTAMSGVYLVYPLATLTTETAQPYQNPQRAYSDGIEEMVDAGVSASTRDVAIPVGNNSTYCLSDTLPPIEDYVDGTAKILETEISTKADNSVIGTAEGSTASKAWSVGEHFIRDGAFCTCTQPIAQGGTFTLNTNYRAGDVASVINNIANLTVTPTATGDNIFSYPDGFNKDNTIVIAIGIEDGNGDFRYGIGTHSNTFNRGFVALMSDGIKYTIYDTTTLNYEHKISIMRLF